MLLMLLLKKSPAPNAELQTGWLISMAGIYPYGVAYLDDDVQ